MPIAAAGEVARHRDDELVRAVFEAGRVHFHREPAAVGALVVDLDHVRALARWRAHGAQTYRLVRQITGRWRNVSSADEPD